MDGWMGEVEQQQKEKNQYHLIWNIGSITYWYGKG
jgi:hypothetical protein